MNKRIASIAWSVMLFGLFAGLLSSLHSAWVSDQKRIDEIAVYYNAVGALKGGGLLSEDLEYWVGVVTELYRFGNISRELAEADTAPLNPLVDHPRPFHGYYVRAMDSGPSPTILSEENILFKGKTRVKGTSAFCIYPAENSGSDLPIYIVCPWGVFRKATDGNEPVLSWPKDIRNFESGWSIVD